MKKMGNALCLFAFAAVQLFAEEENVLKDAGGYQCLSSYHINGLNSWTQSSCKCVGADVVITAENIGLITSLSCPDNYMVGITFESDESSPPKHLVAERSVRTIGATK